MSKGKKVTIGYRYRLGFHLVLCQGGADAITRIRYEDREAWKGTISTNQTLTINKPDLFGGDKKQGGLQGDIDFMFGGASQAVNSYLAYHSNKSVIPDYLSQYDYLGGANGWATATGGTNSNLVANGGVAVPAYRGVVSMVFKNFMYGAMSPYLKPFRITVRRLPRVPNAIDYVITTPSSGTRNHANPAYIIYDVLTNQQWGQGIPTGDVNLASFTAAAAALSTEKFGISILWKQEGTADDFINLILSHISATLYPDPATGQYTLKLMRADYDPNSLMTLDETNVLSLRSFQRTSTNDLTNELTVEYSDPDSEKEAKVTVQNLAALRSVGKVVRRVIQYPGICSSDLAARVAQRDLLAFSTPLAKLSIEVNLSAWNLRPGDVFKFSWAKLGIESVIFRVMEIEYGGLRDNKITITAVEDIFAVSTSSYIGTQAPLWKTAPTALTDITNYKLFDAPYYTLVQHFGEDYVTNLADNRNFVSVVIPRANGTWTDYKLYELVSGSYVERDSGSFSPFVTLTNAITQTQTGVTYSGYFDIDLVTIGSIGVIDNEWVAVDNIDKTTKVLTLKRGIFDSVPATHAAGAIMYLYGDNYLLDEDTERFASESVTYKFQPSAGGETYSLASATARSYTVNGRQQRPYPPGNVRLNGTYFPSTIIDDVAVSWVHRNRTTQTVAPISWTSGSVTTEAGVTYTLTFYRGATSTVVYTSSGLTGTSLTATDTELGEEDDLRLELKSIRSGIENFQTFSHRFYRNTTKDEYGTRVLLDSPSGYWRLSDPLSSTSVVDSSVNARTGTAVNGVVFQSTALTVPASKNKAATFDGTDDYISVPDALAFYPDYVTAELWVQFTNLTHASSALISKSENGGWALRVDTVAGVASGQKSLQFLAYRSGVPTYAGFPVSSLSANVPYHVVGTYDGRYTRLFIDGILVALKDSTTTAPISYNSNNSLIIGAEAGPLTTPTGEYLPGTLDDVSVYVGALSSDVILARYRSGTGRITYREDPFWDKVVCSLHMNGSNGSTTFTDSKGGTTWTAYGNASISTTQSKFGGASAYFDGSGDYIRTTYVPTTMNWWTGNFTLECWVYPTSLTNWGPSYSRMIGNMDATGATNWWSFGPNASGYVSLYYYDGTAYTITTTTTISANAWSHIALVVVGTRINIYINGVSRGTGTITGNPTASASFPLTIGQYGNTCIAGYIDDLRITRAARYLKTFTPPVEQFPDRQCVSDTQDPFWNETVLLMHMNGANNSTTFTDVRGKTVTAFDNAKISTAQSKFGGSSAYFDGASDYISIPDSADFDFGSGPFTVEMWIYPTSTSSQRLFMGQSDSGGSNYSPFRLEIVSGNYNFLISQTGSAWAGGTGTLTAPATANTWTHIALVRLDTTVTLYVDGAAKGSRTISGAIFNSASPMLIGAGNAGGFAFAGYIDELRVTKGAARYTRDFAPPKLPFPDSEFVASVNGTGALVSSASTVSGNAVKTSNLTGSGQMVSQSSSTFGVGNRLAFNDPYWSNVVLLLDGEANTTADKSSYRRATTNTDTLFLAVFSLGKVAKAGSYLMKTIGFGGPRANYYAASPEFNLGSADFTIELWTYSAAANTPGQNQIIIGQTSNPLSNLASSFAFGQRDDGRPFGTIYSGTTAYTAEALSAAPGYSVWKHFALVRDGNTLRLFVNGSEWATRDVTGVVANTSTGVVSVGTFGNSTDNYLYEHDMDNIRMTVGVARYTTAFTPPDWYEPKPVDPYQSYVNFLMRMTGADTQQIFYDIIASPIRQPLVFGNAQTSTAKAWSGTSSAYFDGNGDYLSFAHSTDFNLSSGDSCVEMWFYPTALTSDNQTLIDKDGVFGSTTPSYSIQITSDGKLRGIVGNGTANSASSTIGSTTIVLNAWNHAALVISGGSLTGGTYSLYLNGQLEGSSAINGNMVDGGKPMLIGYAEGQPTANFFRGYIDDIRITKGVTRYSGNFTTPLPFDYY